eukprot:50379-Eustigmatos_ZCMA.PRE.1
MQLLLACFLTYLSLTLFATICLCGDILRLAFRIALYQPCVAVDPLIERVLEQWECVAQAQQGGQAPIVDVASEGEGAVDGGEGCWKGGGRQGAEIHGRHGHCAGTKYTGCVRSHR